MVIIDLSVPGLLSCYGIIVFFNAKRTLLTLVKLKDSPGTMSWYWLTLCFTFAIDYAGI